MTTRKNYNSVVFLTTLSVYLGLVLVGAPAPVLAQVENRTIKIDSSVDLTNAEVKRFIEYNYADKLKQFAEGTSVRIQYLKTTAPEEIKDEKFYAKAITFSPCIDEDNGELAKECYKDSDNNVEWMSAAHAGIMADVSLELLDHFSDVSKQKAKRSVFQSSVEAVLNDSEYKFELVIKKSSSQRANSLANNLELAVNYSVASAKDSFAKQIYENTKVSSENNQVFIVTRLPRGSLDAFLTQKSAK